MSGARTPPRRSLSPQNSVRSSRARASADASVHGGAWSPRHDRAAGQRMTLPHEELSPVPPPSPRDGVRVSLPEASAAGITVTFPDYGDARAVRPLEPASPTTSNSSAASSAQHSAVSWLQSFSGERRGGSTTERVDVELASKLLHKLGTAEAQAAELEHQKQLLAHRDVELRLKTDAQLKVEAELEATARRLKEEQGARALLEHQMAEFMGESKARSQEEARAREARAREEAGAQAHLSSRLAFAEEQAAAEGRQRRQAANIAEQNEVRLRLMEEERQQKTEALATAQQQLQTEQAETTRLTAELKHIQEEKSKFFASCNSMLADAAAENEQLRADAAAESEQLVQTNTKLQTQLEAQEKQLVLAIRQVESAHGLAAAEIEPMREKLQRLEERAAAEREEAAKSAKAHEQALSKLEQESRAEEEAHEQTRAKLKAAQGERAAADEAHEQTRAKLKAARDELESSPRDSLLRELRDEKRRQEDVSRLGARLRSNQESERKAREESFRRVEDVFKRARQGAGLEAQ